MPGAQPAIHRPPLPINIARLVAPQEQRHARHLVRHGAPPQRIQLPHFPLRAARPRQREQRRRHARLDQARHDGVHPDARARQLEGGRLRQAPDRGLGGGVVGRAGVAAEPGDGARGDDAPARMSFLVVVGRLHHGGRRVLDGHEHAQHVGPQRPHEFLPAHVPEVPVRPRHARVGEEHVQPSVPVESFVYDGFHGRFVAGVEAARVDVDGRVEGLQLAGVGGEVGVVEVADVEGAGAVVGVLVGGGAADAEGGVGAGDDDHFVLYSPVAASVPC